MLYHYIIALLVTCVVHLGLSVLVYLRGQKRLTNITYALYSTAISWWSGFEAFSIFVHDQSLALFLWRLNHIGVIFIPVFFVHFVTSLLDHEEQKRRKKIVWISYGIALGFALLDVMGILIQDVESKFSFRYFIKSSALYPFFFALWVLWAVYGLWNLFKIFIYSKGLIRKQFGYFCWSMVCAYVGGAPNFLPTFNIEIPILMPFGTYAIPFYGAITAYAIARYQLLDIRVAVSRATIFCVVYGLLLILPVVFLFPSQRFLLDLMSGSFWWLHPLAIVCYAGIASLAPFIYRYFQRKTEERLLKHQRLYQQVLREMAKEMTFIKNLDRLLKIIVLRLKQTIGIEHASIYLFDGKDYALKYTPKYKKKNEEKINFPSQISKDEPLVQYLSIKKAPLIFEELKENHQTRTLMRELKAEIIIPSFIRGDLIGFVALGEKPNGDIYTQDDLSVFEILSAQAALAIENANHLKRLEVMHQQALEAVKFQATAEMMGAMNHELKNLMGKTRLFVELTQLKLKKGGVLEEEDMSKLTRSQQFIDTASEILTDVSFCRGKISRKEWMEVKIQDLIDAALEKLKGRIEEAGIEVIREIQEDLGPIRVKAGFEDLFVNLLKSIYFTLSENERWEKRLWIRAWRSADGIEVEIKDSGEADFESARDSSLGAAGGGRLFTERKKLGGVNFYLAQWIAHENGFPVKINSDVAHRIGMVFQMRIP